MSRPDYEYLWRPSVEIYPAIGWLVVAVVTVAYALAADVGKSTSTLMALLALGLSAFRGSQLVSLWITKTRLASFRVDSVSLDELERIVRAANPPSKPGLIYWGDGFDVETRHTQAWYDLRRLTIHEVTPPDWAMAIIAKWKQMQLTEDRTAALTAWIDAVESNKRPILHSMNAQAGHTFCVGATRAGKTTLLIINTLQRAMMGHMVINIDPKGDDDFEAGQREVARRLNRPFVLIDPARPSESARVSLLANFNRYTEVPSRIVSVLPESDFKAFGWCFTSRYVAGMLMVGEKPSIATIKLYIQGGSRVAASLLERCIRKWMQEAGIDPDSIVHAPSEGGKAKPLVDRFILAYQTLAAQRGYDDVIEGLVATYRHNDEHYQKITMNLLPVLEKLTAGELTGLFSPDASDIDDPRPLWDVESMVEQKAIVYFRLDSLSDSEVGSAIGTMFLSNVVAVAGARYNQGSRNTRVSLNVDELAEVANIPFIQLENKGGGALFDITFFTQNVQDLTARFGSTAYRDMILGNANNLITFRVSGKDTVDYVMDRIGKTEIHQVDYGQSLSQRTDDSLAHFGGSVSRSIKVKEADVFPRDLLPKLPTFHYIAVFQGGRTVKGVVPLLTIPKSAIPTQREYK